MTQTRIDGNPDWKIDKPPQNNYTLILKELENVYNEIFYLRHEWEDNKRDLFDLNEMIGRLATKIEEWVGVAEE